MPDLAPSCPCGCGSPTEAGYQYAGANSRERERHRAKANRYRKADGRQRQDRLDAAVPVLAELGLRADSPGPAVAAELEAQADKLLRLVVVVAAELKACDPAARRESEQRLQAEHRTELTDLQSQLDQARSAHRAAEREGQHMMLELEQARLAVAELQADRDNAIREAENAHDQVTAAQQRTVEAVSQAEQANSVATEMAAALEAAQMLVATAVEAQMLAEAGRDGATSELREQMLRTAQVLAEQERRAGDALTAALATADRRGSRERRSALAALREAHERELHRLQVDLAAARQNG